MSHPLAKLEWQTSVQPVLSAMTTKEHWCHVSLYNPSVVKHDGRYWMWYVGQSDRTRAGTNILGLAMSDDGIAFTPIDANPILTAEGIGFGNSVNTPHVIWDVQQQCFRMWFTADISKTDESGQQIKNAAWQGLAYASSPDGIDWQVHPELLWPRLRSPSVVQTETGYLMWAGAAADPTSDNFDDIVKGLYRFTSDDGLSWQRDDAPCITPHGAMKSVVYPFVHHDNDGFVMWYSGHVESGQFEIYVASSTDGKTWTYRDLPPVLPATGNRNRFDGRYTSTPTVIVEDDRVLLYYSARDMGNLYGAGDGTVRFDASGIYRHIGVAVAERG